jgi:hypothetical protein
MKNVQFKRYLQVMDHNLFVNVSFESYNQMTTVIWSHTIENLEKNNKKI